MICVQYHLDLFIDQDGISVWDNCLQRMELFWMPIDSIMICQRFGSGIEGCDMIWYPLKNS